MLLGWSGASLNVPHRLMFQRDPINSDRYCQRSLEESRPRCYHRCKNEPPQRLKSDPIGSL